MRSVRLLLERLDDLVEEGVKAWGLAVAEREKVEAERRREQDALREQQRQRDAVTEDWQRRLREEAEKRRAGGAEAKGDEKPAEGAAKGADGKPAEPEEPAGPVVDLGGGGDDEE